MENKLSRSSIRPGRPSTRRAAYAAIRADDRLYSRAQHTRGALIDDVMKRWGVTRSNARKMICTARKVRG